MRRQPRPKQRAIRLPEGLFWNAVTIGLAVGMLLIGYVLAIRLDGWLPSGKNVLATSTTRHQLDESWWQNLASGKPLGLFPYDVKADVKVSAMDDSAWLAAQEGMKRILLFSQIMESWWPPDSINSNRQFSWSVSKNDGDGDMGQFLAAVMDTSAATDVSYGEVTQQPATDTQVDAGLGDAQYVGVMRCAMPGLSSPDRWLAYRVPVAWYVDQGEKREYMADAVYHPSKGLVHLFLHGQGTSFPSSFTQASADVPLQYVKVQCTAFLEQLLPYGQKMSSFPSDKVEDAWQPQGEGTEIDLQGITSAEVEACYLADDLCAVSFPCEDGGHFFLYMDMTSMSICGFSRQYIAQ